MVINFKMITLQTLLIVKLKTTLISEVIYLFNQPATATDILDKQSTQQEHPPNMHLMYTFDTAGNRIYTLKVSVYAL